MTRSGGPHKDNDPPPFEPLPDNVFSHQTHPSWHDAYARCTRLFFWAVGRQPPPGAASYDMCSRVLGHLVLEAPTERGRDWVCKRILSCPDEHALALLAQKYIFIFIGAFKASAGQSFSSGWGSSSLSTPGGFGGGAATGGLGEGGAHVDYQEKRIFVLERDAYKCSITGTSGADPASGALLDVTPIIPPSIDIRTLSRYAGLPSDDPLCEPTLRFYRLENMLTLDDDASDAFRSLNVWLEETGRNGEYQIVTWQSSTVPESPRYTTTFTTTDLKTRPIPSTHYLRLHAACARVAHKSGAATYIEDLAKDIARLTVLAEDGSSAGVLAAALARAAAT